MNHNKFILLALILLLTPMRGHAEESSTSMEPQHRRETAVQEARAGKFDFALPALAELSAQFPNDLGIQSDYIVALIWAKQQSQALDLAESHPAEQLPTYCLRQLAKAARDVGQHARAQSLYDILMAREPENLDFQLGKTLTLVDAQLFNKAETKLIELQHTHADNPQVYRALSYWGQQTKQPVAVIDASLRLLAIDKKDKEAAHALIRAAGEVGAYPQALAFSQAYPEAIADEHIRIVKNDNAAHHISWGHIGTADPQKRFDDTDQALQRLDEICQCNWKDLALTDKKNLNLIFDRIVALRDRFRMDEVIFHHQQLSAAKIEMSDYVLNASGDAYLYKLMPEQALDAYETSLKKNPDNVQTKFAKFHALIELEDFDRAVPYIDDVAQFISPLRNRPNNPVIRPDEYRLDADIKSLYARAFGDDFAYAQQGLEKLHHAGPMNTDVNMSLGEIWRWRGWHERAQNHFKHMGEDYPTLTFPNIQLAHTYIDLREWERAEDQVQALENIYPENLLVQEISRRWQLHNKRELIADINSTRASGGTFGSHAQGMNATLYSKPFNTHYRAFVSTQFDRATFPEGDGRAFFPNIGLEYTDRLWRLTGSAGYMDSENNKLTTTLTADYRMDDFWSFNALLDINSRQMPLRGLRDNVNGHLVQAGANYRWSDLMSGAVSFTYLDMDDGNQRKTASALFDRRLITRPHYKLTTHLRADTSYNTENNTLYYNPEHDLDLSATLDNVWMLWRRYDRSFSHRLELGAGQYWQKNDGSNNTWQLTYEHQWRWDNMLELDYGVMRYMHPYDGNDEYFTQFYARINLLF